MPVAPEKGAALCFWQSFKLGRDGVRDSAFAPVHEGSPVTGGGAKLAVRSDVACSHARRGAGAVEVIGVVFVSPGATPMVLPRLLSRGIRGFSRRRVPLSLNNG